MADPGSPKAPPRRVPERTPKMPAPGLDGPTTVDTSPPIADDATRRVQRAEPWDDPTRVERVDLGEVSKSTSLPKVCGRCGMRYPLAFKACPRDGAQLAEAPSSADPLVGCVLGETYVLVRLIGEGGMGRVYEARHHRIATKRFALKMLHPELAHSAEVLARFQREAEAAASIGSAHVADVYDIGRAEDGSPFIVAELVDGPSLAAVLKDRGRLDVAAAVRIMTQLCDAIESAHRRGVIHRDLKPENIIVVGQGPNITAKIIDFGLSKVLESKQGLTKAGMIMGTPAYMPPEQARGEHVDHRADVYALGAILYELVTGKRPFDRPDAVATIAAVLIEEPAPPRALVPDLPEPIARAIARAMSKHPDGRFRSAEELAAAIAPAATANVTAVAQPATSAPRPDEASVRARFAGFAAGGAISIVCVATTMVLALVRVSRGPSGRVSAAEAATAFAGVAFALSGPAAFGGRLAYRAAWRDARRAALGAAWSRAATLALLVTYGCSAVIVRLADPLLAKSGAGMAWPVWELLAGGASLAAAAAALLVTSRRQ